VTADPTDTPPGAHRIPSQDDGATSATGGRDPAGDDSLDPDRRPGGTGSGADGAVDEVDHGAVTPGPGEGTAAGRRGTSRGEHAIRGTLAAALILEGLTVLFVPQTLAALSADGLGGVRLGLLLGLAAALFVAAGIQKFRAGLVLGSVLQIPVIALGVMVGAMYVLGLLFAGIWIYLLRVRQEILQVAHQAPPA